MFGVKSLYSESALSTLLQPLDQVLRVYLCREKTGTLIQLDTKLFELKMVIDARWKFMKVLRGLYLRFVAKLSRPINHYVSVYRTREKIIISIA